MSAFDRLQNYSAKKGLNETSEVFDVKTPSGAFLNRVHNEGYKMYNYVYRLSSDNNIVISEEDYEKCDNKEDYIKEIKYTELHNAITTTGNQVINAIAGSGKTTAIVFKILYDIVTGEAVRLQSIPNGTQVRVVNKMWVCTFLKTGAEELEASLTKWQRKLGYSQTANQISFSTLDAEFKRCLNAMGVATNIGDAGKLHSLLCQAIDSCNITRNGEKLSKEDYRIISGIITYCRGRLDDKRYQHPSCQDYSITPTILNLIIKQYANLRQANGIMDFDEVMELLYKYLYITPNPAVQDFVANRYNYIYIDEFQDTSQIQYALLKFYARGKLWLNRSGEELKVQSEGGTIPDGLYTAQETIGKIVAIGDVSQCLLPGTKIETTLGEKNIEDICFGDIIKSAIGWGKSDYIPIDDLKVSDYNGTILNITLESGKTISCTPSHKMFTRIEPDDSVYYVYLMYKQGFGFRIGQTKGVRSGKLKNGFEIRLRQECADRLWLLCQCSSSEEALYFENYYSYKWGIPQYVFDSRDNDTIMSVSKIQRLHEELNTTERGMNLLASKDFNFELPTYSAKASAYRSTLNFAMFDCNQHRYNGVYPSVVSSNYTDCNDGSEEIISKYISPRDKKSTSTNKPYKLYDYITNNLNSIEELMSSIKSDMDNNEIFINTIRTAKLTDKYYTVMPASQLFKGFKLCIVLDDGSVVEDTIVDITRSYYKGKVYDINIEGTRNFSANGIIVHNCIYSFKGSDSHILEELFDNDFRPTNCKLSYNWRCPKNILQPVVSSIHNNKGSANQKIVASKDGGEFSAVAFPSFKAMISALKTDILKDIDDDMNVAVLCRTNFDGMIPALALEAEGKYNFSISGDNMTLNSPLPKKIIAISSLFTERSSPAVRSSLEYFAPYGGKWQVKQLVDTLKMNNMSIWQIPDADLKYSAPDLYPIISGFKKQFVIDGVRDKKLEIGVLRDMYCWLFANKFYGDSAFAESARAYIETLIYIIDSNYFETVYDFIETVGFYNDKLQGRIKKNNVNIRIATVHEFKGKEADSVYVWNDSINVFPSDKCDVYDVEQLEEERRVHYIACTRAKKREHIYCLKRSVGRFVREMDLTLEEPKSVGVTLTKSS